MIICNINLFDINQTIIEVDDEHNAKILGIVNVEDLSNSLCSFAYNINDFQIHLYGPRFYVEQVKTNTLSLNVSTYNNSKTLEIEVN